MSFRIIRPLLQNDRQLFWINATLQQAGPHGVKTINNTRLDKWNATSTIRCYLLEGKSLSRITISHSISKVLLLLLKHGFSKSNYHKKPDATLDPCPFIAPLGFVACFGGEEFILCLSAPLKSWQFTAFVETIKLWLCGPFWPCKPILIYSRYK